MNNTGKKILILGIVIAIAVASILAFYPTIVAPPTGVEVVNLHKQSVEEDINNFSNIQDYKFNDELYGKIIDKLDLYKDEEFMSESEIDYQIKSLVKKYVPIFIESCDEKFRASVWNEEDHKKILNRINQLKALRVDFGSAEVIVGSDLDNINRIEKVIYNYKKAKKVAEYIRFYSVDNANQKIEEADNYSKMTPLHNCTSLVNKLSKVKINIGNSHYSFVETEVNRMGNYRYMIESDFDKLTQEVYGKIAEYRNNKHKYGSTAKSEVALNDKARQFYDEAKIYFMRKEISINTNSQWVSMSSPSTLYRAYQSSSNYNRHSSDAMMYFTIKGYETFTFYVRSNGESAYDYVLVGLNQRPSLTSHYITTKDKPNSGTSFSNYTKVTIPYLSKTQTYTIYVVYHKDNSNNFGTDRGYVLIPYENN